MKAELKELVYKEILEHPTLSDYQISAKLNVSRPMVWRIRNKLIGAIDYELAKKVAGKFLVDFQMASDYFKLQIERLETLKTQNKTIQRNNVHSHEIETSRLPWIQ